MRVIELAQDLKVDSEVLIHLLREMGIHISDEGASITDGQVAKVLARVERERRAGHKTSAEAIQAALEEASSGPRRRRRRKAADMPPLEPPVEEVVVEDGASEDDEADEADEIEAESEEAPDAEGDEVDSEQEDEPEEAEPESEEDEAEPESEEDEAAAPVAETSDEGESGADEDAEDATSEAEDSEEEEADSPPPVDVEVDAEVDADVLTPRPSATPPAPARKGAPDGPVRTIRRPAPAATAGPGGQVRIQAEGYTPDGRRQERDKKKVTVVSADVYRPAAIKQLETLAAEVGADFFPSTADQKPIAIVKAAVEHAKIKFSDVLIIDTAGRLAVDGPMMAEIAELHAAVNPVETLFVVDAMTGQDAANTAKAFGETLPLTGVISPASKMCCLSSTSRSG